MHQAEHDVPQIRELDLAGIPKGTLTPFWVHLINNAIGEPVRIPMLVARGAHDGPTLGLTAAIHGNELNGIAVIEQIFENINVQHLRGTIVGVLALNVPGVLAKQRKFNDDTDLNRIAPGKPNGNNSETYIHRVVERIIKHFDCLIDLHTASFGRINSWYVRADMTQEPIARMALLQCPDIILHNPPSKSSLRGAAAELGIPTITMELKNPYIFQKEVIENAVNGIRNVLYDRQMLEGTIRCTQEKTLVCDNAYWTYTDEGGMLRVLPEVLQRLKKGEPMAQVRTIFGKMIKAYYAPEDGIVIGKSVNPTNQTGSRILHLGINVQELACPEQ